MGAVVKRAFSLSKAWLTGRVQEKATLGQGAVAPDEVSVEIVKPQEPLELLSVLRGGPGRDCRDLGGVHLQTSPSYYINQEGDKRVGGIHTSLP